jgi:hypothetical protein
MLPSNATFSVTLPAAIVVSAYPLIRIANASGDTATDATAQHTQSNEDPSNSCNPEGVQIKVSVAVGRSLVVVQINGLINAVDPHISCKISI